MAKRPPNPSSDLARVLCTLRAAAGLTQAELERGSGVRASSISEYESGKVAPSRRTLGRLLQAMGLPEWAPERMQELLRELRDGARGPGVPLPGPPDPTDRERGTLLVARLGAYDDATQDALLAETPAFDSWVVAESLALQSSRAASRDADQALALARRAMVIAERPVVEEPWWSKLRAYALAHLANAWRVKGDLPQAGLLFAEVAAAWEVGRTADRYLRQEERIEALRSSYLISSGRLDEARSVLLSLVASSESSTLRVAHLLNLARAFEETGDFEQALDVLRQAAPSVDACEDERLRLVLRHNLLWLLTTTGRFTEAAAFLPEVVACSQRFGSELDWVRLLWARGRIAAGTGHLEEGAGILARVRGEFASRGIAFDAALVTLEIAQLHAEAGRHAQVKDLARHLAPLVSGQSVHPHAQAALALFRQAAERAAVTPTLARELVSYLRAVRLRPGSPFVPGPA